MKTEEAALSVEITTGEQWKPEINYWVASSRWQSKNIDDREYFQE